MFFSLQKWEWTKRDTSIYLLQWWLWALFSISLLFHGTTVCLYDKTNTINKFKQVSFHLLYFSNSIQFFFSKDFSKLNFKHFLHGGVNVTGFDLVNTEEPNVKSFLRKWRTANQAIYPAAGHPLMVINTVYKPPNSLINQGYFINTAHLKDCLVSFEFTEWQ